MLKLLLVIFWFISGIYNTKFCIKQIKLFENDYVENILKVFGSGLIAVISFGLSLFYYFSM